MSEQTLCQGKPRHLKELSFCYISN